jgi:periplasmic protein CpxP/Spy
LHRDNARGLSLEHHKPIPGRFNFSRGDILEQATSHSRRDRFGARQRLYQPADAPATQQPADHAPAAKPRARPHRDFSSHIEGRIAYLKAELKITPAQQAQFDKLAQAMRENAAERQKDFDAMRDQRRQAHNAVDRLETSVKLAQQHTRAQERYLAAFKPLYASLSADQKHAADSLLAPHRFGHHRRGA